MTRNVKEIIVSSVISIAITLVFGYYFLYLGDREREPTFYLDPIRTTIIDKSNAAAATLHLLKANGDTINSDVVSVYFYFFNQGRQTIKHENIYSPLKVKLGNAEILDFKVLKVARDVSGIVVSKDTLTNSLDIDFKALEKDDGFVGQVIFEGKKDAAISIEGGIEGAKYFKSELSSINPLYFLIAIFIFLVAAYILLLLNKRNSKTVPKALFFFSAIPVLYLVLMLYKSSWFIYHKVPETLRIEQYVQQTKNQLFELPAWFSGS
jgi:hypothetical protein